MYVPSIDTYWGKLDSILSSTGTSIFSYQSLMYNQLNVLLFDISRTDHEKSLWPKQVAITIVQIVSNLARSFRTVWIVWIV